MLGNKSNALLWFIYHFFLSLVVCSCWCCCYMLLLLLHDNFYIAIRQSPQLMRPFQLKAFYPIYINYKSINFNQLWPCDSRAGANLINRNVIYFMKLHRFLFISHYCCHQLKIKAESLRGFLDWYFKLFQVDNWAFTNFFGLYIFEWPLNLLCFIK